jgi:hypothetical protein
MQLEGSTAAIEPSIMEALTNRFVRLLWRLDALCEKGRALMEGRGPEDFDRDRDSRRNEQRQILRALKIIISQRTRPNNYINGGGRDLILKLILGVIATLVAAGVIGEIVMYGQFREYHREQVDEYTEHERRIERLERIDEARTAQPIPH